MLALSSFALSYAPAFVAPPLAVRSTAVHMNHGMRPVFYDHDQEVRPGPLLITQLTNSTPVAHNSPTPTLPFSRVDRALEIASRRTRRP